MSDEQGTPNGDPTANPPDLAGYNSVDDLARGYRNSSQEAKRLKAEAARAQAERDLLAQQLNELQRPAIPQRNRPQDELSALGIPVDPIAELVDQRVRSAFEPLVRGMEARNRVLSSVPDYAKHEAEIANWINSDPERVQAYSRAFQGDPVVAMEWAAQGYARERRREKRDADEGRARGAADAQIPTNRQGDSRRPPNEGYDAALAKARERYQQTGSRQDAEAFARMRLHKVISEEFLSQ